MLTPNDHCLRPARSFLSFLGLKPHSPVPSQTPRSYGANIRDSSVLRHELPKPMSSLQIRIDEPALAHASPQPLGMISVPRIWSPSSPPSDCPSASASSPLQQEVHINIPSQSLHAEYNERPLSSSGPHINTPILLRPAKAHAQSLNQQSSVAPPYYSLHHELTRGCSQVSQPEHQLEQPFSNQDLSQSPITAIGTFYRAHDFIIKDPVFIGNDSDRFMLLLLKETILGAEFDSSDPNMPLRCHQGTRVEIIKRCQDFVLNREGRPQIRWVVGAAGVGKSAVMQSVAHDEYEILSSTVTVVIVTIFFSFNGRQDGTKAITTIAYQLAVKLHSYRRFVQREIAHDPSIPHKSLSTQFKKFIIEPFINRRIPDCPSCLLIIIDGLDECANPSTQLELLGLISNFCASYPESPLVWMIASRPEPHITSFFSQPEIVYRHEMEQIFVDSDDAHQDVKLYLQDKFREIQIASLTLRHFHKWPSDGDFSKIAEASGGLFAYASTVVRYVGEPTYGNPVGQLDDVLEIIETGTSSNLSGEDHPMARLDALYGRIMSRIPTKVRANTRKLLVLYIGTSHLRQYPFHFGCNILGMTENAAYGATHHIRAVANIPGPQEAPVNGLTFFHKSYPDYLRDFQRSEFSRDIVSEAEQLMAQYGLRIIGEAPSGITSDGTNEHDLWLWDGKLKNGPGTGDNISISWPVVGEDDNHKLRLYMYRGAIWEVMNGLRKREEAFQSLLCLRVLTKCFEQLPHQFPSEALRDTLFDESRRCELLDHGILKEVPLETLENGRTWDHVFNRLRFRSVTPFDPWNASCRHEREGNWEGPNQDWSTSLYQDDPCLYCVQRFKHQLKVQLPGHFVTVCDLTPADAITELRFVDPDDGVSEWVYHFLGGRMNARRWMGNR